MWQVFARTLPAGRIGIDWDGYQLFPPSAAPETMAALETATEDAIINLVRKIGEICDKEASVAVLKSSKIADILTTTVLTKDRTDENLALLVKFALARQ